jgi:hypothetical protein
VFTGVSSLVALYARRVRTTSRWRAYHGAEPDIEQGQA